MLCGPGVEQRCLHCLSFAASYLIAIGHTKMSRMLLNGSCAELPQLLT